MGCQTLIAPPGQAPPPVHHLGNPFRRQVNVAHVSQSRKGPILALALRLRSVKPFELFPLGSKVALKRRCCATWFCTRLDCCRGLTLEYVSHEAGQTSMRRDRCEQVMGREPLAYHP